MPASFLAHQQSSTNSNLLRLVLRCREFEARLRPRLLLGWCWIGWWLPEPDHEILEVLVREVLIVMENIGECDVAIECYNCLRALLGQSMGICTRNSLVKRWLAVLSEAPYKKDYIQYYLFLLQAAGKEELGVPARQRYLLAVNCIQLTKNLQQQYTRFVFYSGCCSSIVQMGRRAGGKGRSCSLLLNLFQYSWFIDRLNQQNDLFKSELLIGLLDAFARQGGEPSRQEVGDLLGLCHRLIDWKCTSKQETHIPTLKFAFDMYLEALVRAGKVMGELMESVVVQLIGRTNEPSIYFVFKFKLVGALLQLQWYQANAAYLQGTKINLTLMEEQMRLVMMPKNPKPIFLYDYSLSFDGQVESKKQIEYIKIIMGLLIQIPRVHEAYASAIDALVLDYHTYLAALQCRPDSNKQLINCLQKVEADYYLTDCHRSFLLALMHCGGNSFGGNYELNLEGNIVRSPLENVETQDEVNIFGPMSPVHLSIRLANHSSYSSVYIHIKKNQWVQVDSLKLIISSGLQKKELPFESSIVQMRVDRFGALHFQVWTTQGTQLLLGSGNYRIRRHLKWTRCDHLAIIDGIRQKAYFKPDPNAPLHQTFLSYYYGQPLLIRILRPENEVVVSLTNKESWLDLKQVISSLVDELVTGTALIIS